MKSNSLKGFMFIFISIYMISFLNRFIDGSISLFNFTFLTWLFLLPFIVEFVLYRTELI